MEGTLHFTTTQHFNIGKFQEIEVIHFLKKKIYRQTSRYDRYKYYKESKLDASR